MRLPYLPTDCMQINQDEDGNILSLRINMPTVEEKDEVAKDQSFASNPLSMEPKLSPSTKREKVEKNEEEQEIFNPSPFKITP
ncbi:hypothetical protein SCJ08_12680 [Legionella pneumophila serogroup 1]